MNHNAINGFLYTLVTISMFQFMPLMAHTSAETNAVVRGALGSFVCYSARGIGDLPRRVSPTEIPDNWNNFLGGHLNDGWTLDEKKAAFDWYLGTLGTNDCVAMSGWDKGLVHAALVQCQSLHHTNCVPAMTALVLNPRGIYRQRALDLVLEFGDVDTSLTSFVETVMTNSQTYTLMERSTASCHYADRLMNFSATNAVQITARDNAVRMIYRNRMGEPAATEIVDRLFKKYIGGYETSSNRLAFAVNAIAYPDCDPDDESYFTSVTNQLLSSGQPLVQLNIGEGE